MLANTTKPPLVTLYSCMVAARKKARDFTKVKSVEIGTTQ